MSNGLGLSLAAEVPGVDQSASMEVDVGVGVLSAKLEVQTVTGESKGQDGLDEVKSQETGEKKDAAEHIEDQTLDATDSSDKTEAQPTDSSDKTEAQPTDSSDKTKAQPAGSSDKTEAQPTDSSDKTKAQPSDTSDKTEAQPSDSSDKTEAQPSDTSDKTEAQPAGSSDKTEAQPSDTSDKTEAQPSDSSDKTETQPSDTCDKTEAQPSDTCDKTEAQPAGSSDKTEAQPAGSSDKTEAQPSDTSDKTEAQPSDSSDKTEAQPSDTCDKTEAQPSDTCDKTEAQPSDASDKTEAQPAGSSDKTEAQPAGSSDKTEAQPADALRKRRPESGYNSGDSSNQKGSSNSLDKDVPASHRGFKIFGIEFAPLNTPMRRRLQTFAVMQWLLSITVMPVICVLLILLTLVTPLAPLSLAYIAWIFIFDRKTSQRGGRRYDSVRRWSLWEHYRDYFPIRLVKSAELDPRHNYLIGYHPHGIISCGAFCNFNTEATGFSAKFPGIKPYLLTLRINFFWPLLRGYFMATGVCDVSRSSLQWILGREGGGNAAIIVVGGAQEALDARPGNYKLTLLKRKGFARMALQTGAHLVPCFSFGENDLFRQAANPPGSWVRKFQQVFKGTLGSSPPFFYGRGVFNYTFGLLPYRHPVTTVVGAAIPVEKCAQPSSEQVNQLHREYMLRLAELFDQHKAEHGVSEDVRLEFV